MCQILSIVLYWLPSKRLLEIVKRSEKRNNTSLAAFSDQVPVQM